MRKILFILFVLIGSFVYGQTPNNYVFRNTWERTHGAYADSVQHIPTFCGKPPLLTTKSWKGGAALAYDTCNNKFYAYRDTAWVFIPDSSYVASASQNFANADLTFTGNRTHDANGNSLTIDNVGGLYIGVKGVDAYEVYDYDNPVVRFGFDVTKTKMQSPNGNTRWIMYNDSAWLDLNTTSSKLIINNLASQHGSDTTNNKIAVYNPTTDQVKYMTYWPAGGTPTLQQVLTAGSTTTGDNTIVNGANTIEITNNTLAGDIGLNITSTSTAAAGNSQRLLRAALSGANATSNQATWAAYFQNSHSGTNSQNVALELFSNTGTTNYGLITTATGTGNRAIYSDGNVQMSSLPAASVDTTTYKPLAIDASGNLIPMTGWPGSAGGYTTFSQFVDETAWRTFYSNGIGDVTPLAFGTSGKVLTSNGVSAAPTWETPTGGGWGLSGNAITAGTLAGDFIGSTNNVSMRFRTNNVERMAIDSNGRVGIGTTLPTFPFQVNTASGDLALFQGTSGGFNYLWASDATPASGENYIAATFSSNFGIIQSSHGVGGNLAIRNISGPLYLQSAVSNSVILYPNATDVLNASSTKVQLNVETQHELQAKMKEIAAPSTPATGYSLMYVKSDGLFYGKADDGIETLLSNRTGNLTTNVTDVGNITTGVDDLITYSIPAGQLSTDGDYLEFTMTFDLGANANSKQIRVVYGGTTVYASGAQAQNDGVMEITGKIIRTGATTQRITFSQNNNTTLFTDYADYVTAGETLSGAVTLKATGEGVSTDDIIQKILVVKYVAVN